MVTRSRAAHAEGVSADKAAKRPIKSALPNNGLEDTHTESHTADGA